MNFQYFERMFVFGATQNGKTTFMRYLAKSLTRLVAYDVFKKNWTGLGTVVKTWDEFVRAMHQNNLRVVIQWDDDTEEMFERVNKYIWENASHLTYFVDELHNFTSSNYTPAYFKKLVTMGQEAPRRLGLVMSTQLPAQTDPRIVGNCKHLVSFYIAEVNAREKLAKCGFNEWAECLKELPPFNWVYCNPGARIWEQRKPVPPD